MERRFTVLHGRITYVQFMVVVTEWWYGRK